jgi:hypothetical protein
MKQTNGTPSTFVYKLTTIIYVRYKLLHYTMAMLIMLVMDCWSPYTMLSASILNFGMGESWTYHFIAKIN